MAGAGPDHITSVLVQETLVRWLAQGVELKDVVNLAFHEFFERRDYLPTEMT
jgi:hypothetical protein